MTAVASGVSLVIRRMEAEAARDAATTGAAQEVLKRELLLREMQHRVKNNFQIILSMIELQRQGLPTDAGRDVLGKLADGVMAMSLAHDQLSPTRTGEVLELGGYLRALALAFAAARESVAIEVKCDEAHVTIEQAVPIGLIVNELVTNSLKHAFAASGGAVRIELHATGRRGYATLVVADNGKGLGRKHGEGSGLRLVRALADQVRGELELASCAEGTTTMLRFPPRER
jgi:two-component sensor histidine kinase